MDELYLSLSFDNDIISNSRKVINELDLLFSDYKLLFICNDSDEVYNVKEDKVSVLEYDYILQDDYTLLLVTEEKEIPIFFSSLSDRKYYTQLLNKIFEL